VICSVIVTVPFRWEIARVVYYQRRYFPDVQGREYLDHALLLRPDPGEESVPDLE
jgi:hypothetical protein